MARAVSIGRFDARSPSPIVGSRQGLRFRFEQGEKLNGAVGRPYLLFQAACLSDWLRSVRPDSTLIAEHDVLGDHRKEQ